MEDITVYPGRPYPLGSTWDGGGVDIAIYADHATAVDLCLFNDEEEKGLSNYWEYNTIGFFSPDIRYFSSTQRDGQVLEFKIFWLNWTAIDPSLFAFTQELIHLRKKHPVFCRRRWFQGMPIKGIGLEDIAWLLPDGMGMGEHNWYEDYAKSLAIYLNGYDLRSTGPHGEKITEDNFYLMFNAHHGYLDYSLPNECHGREWVRVLDTNIEGINESPVRHFTGETIRVQGRSIILLKHINAADEYGK